jgi:hypothetical protein
MQEEGDGSLCCSETLLSAEFVCRNTEQPQIAALPVTGCSPGPSARAAPSAAGSGATARLLTLEALPPAGAPWGPMYCGKCVCKGQTNFVRSASIGPIWVSVLALKAGMQYKSVCDRAKWPGTSKEFGVVSISDTGSKYARSVPVPVAALRPSAVHVRRSRQAAARGPERPLETRPLMAVACLLVAAESNQHAQRIHEVLHVVSRGLHLRSEGNMVSMYLKLPSRFSLLSQLSLGGELIQHC